jgi:DNA polymerase bacteriophage-type
MTLHHDFETRSVADLAQVGLDNYACHPTTQVLMLSWAIDDEPVQLWRAHLDGPEIPQQLRALLLDPAVRKSAWNTQFERAIWRHKIGVDSPAAEWEDPMIQARYLSLPGKLELAGPIAGLPVGKAKLKEGRTLIKLFCEPISKGKDMGGFNDWDTHPREWEMFCRYCIQDTEAERAFYRRFMR